jgi:ubiquinone/menaquinone biosynthesis C-methylase UbiE
MRDDWNARAREDMEYFVAFGRPDAGATDFFATASDVVRNLDLELRRAPASERSRWRALEIGCGPARVMRPMASRFAEIHGVDISDEMIRRARENLAGVPNAYVHVGDGTRLTGFPDEWFDFVYSYAVFQHIPSMEAVYEYLREIRRVLKGGGLARLQFNGLPRGGYEDAYDTWSGARFSSAEILQFTESRDFQVLALEGAATQYLWTTWKKQPEGWCAAQRERTFAPDTAQIRRITNASSSEPLAPCRGHFSAISLLVENLPAEAGLHHLRVAIGDSLGTVAYVGPLDNIGLRQVMVLLPDLEATGLLPVELRWLEQSIAPQATVRVIPPGPMVPCIKSVTDGRNFMAGTRIESRTVKVTLEEVARPEEIEAAVDGIAVTDVSCFCTDPRPQRFEFNFRLPEGTAPGEHALEVRIGRRKFAPVTLDVRN